mgnify:CR=1 FL=1
MREILFKAKRKDNADLEEQVLLFSVSKWIKKNVEEKV